MHACLTWHAPLGCFQPSSPVLLWAHSKSPGEHIDVSARDEPGEKSPTHSRLGLTLMRRARPFPSPVSPSSVQEPLLLQPKALSISFCYAILVASGFSFPFFFLKKIVFCLFSLIWFLFLR